MMVWIYMGEKATLNIYGEAMMANTIVNQVTRLYQQDFSWHRSIDYQDELNFTAGLFIVTV